VFLNEPKIFKRCRESQGVFRRMNEELNMSIRRFLKKVGISSQNQIENAWKDKKTVKVKMVLTIEELGLEHTIEGEIGGVD
jgi:hypothetical protein